MVALQPTAGNDQEGETGTGFLVMNLYGPVFVDWHGGSPFPGNYIAMVQAVSTPTGIAVSAGMVLTPPHMLSLLATTAPATEFAP